MIEWFKNKSVAIVGNASFLFDKSYGEEIDKNDVVVRINKGYINLNKKCQGKKTTVLAYNNYSMIDQNLNLIKNFKLIHMSDRFRKKEMIKNIFFYPLKYLKELKEKTKVNRPSTGLMIIDYVGRCEPKNIILYGFDWKDTPTYYEKNRKIEPHDFEKEREYISNLQIMICQ